MTKQLLEEFGNTIDWIAVAVVTVVFLCIVLFFIAAFYFAFKAPQKDDDNDLKLKKDKIEIMLDNQNKHLKKYHMRCKVCGAKINKLSGKCTFCGTKNFDDENKKMH